MRARQRVLNQHMAFLRQVSAPSRPRRRATYSPAQGINTPVRRDPLSGQLLTGTCMAAQRAMQQSGSPNRQGVDTLVSSEDEGL